MAALIPKRVTLFSEDRELAGHLFQSSSATAPGVVVAGSWTTVKEQMADFYDGKLAEAGSTTLTFDFTGFGESTGEPRQYESPHRKIADLDAAARWLAARDDVEGDGVGGLAICASAGYKRTPSPAARRSRLRHRGRLAARRRDGRQDVWRRSRGRRPHR